MRAADSTTTVLDISQLRNITLDDEDLMREIVSALVEDASHQIDILRQAVERADAQECARVAHSARGACGNVGAASLAALFSAVEQSAKGGDLTVAGNALRSLCDELEKLREEACTI
ncbi:MAG: Hpt domain-containing protein [Bryobacteraceae bacterium]